jgi:Cu(I)/Ag(I) efflux system membrane protein CusA/SilA
MFPLQALLGLGAAHHYWQIAFFGVLALVVALTVALTQGLLWQAVSFTTLVLLGLWAYHFPKIGVEFMPTLDEGTLMEMPVSVPRLGLSQAADDLKARDALLRGFPEVESVIGKAGRADTPTDPAPLEMIETFINYRPRELWPRRALRFEDASRQARRVVAALEARGFLRPPADAGERDAVINTVAMNALARFDEALRDLALRRYREFERELEPVLTRFVLDEALRRFEAAGIVHWPEGATRQAEADALAKALTPAFGRWLGRGPALEDVTRLCQEAARQLAALRALKERDPATGGWKELEPADALAWRPAALAQVAGSVAEALGAAPRTFAGEMLKAVQARRLGLWRDYVHKKVNWELFDRGVEAFTWAALEEAGKEAKEHGLLRGTPHGAELGRFAGQAALARQAKAHDGAALEPFVALRKELEAPFAAGLILWRREGGPRGDLVKELDTVVQVPGWSNIWTQPIANRIDMLATGVRTPVGVRVFGPDLETINRVCRDITEAVKPVRGAQNVVATPIMGKGYLEITIDRQKAARYGVRVGDIQDTIEVALGGKVITQTVEGRDRFPVRIRYARDFREDEQQVKRLLVSAGLSSAGGGAAGPPPTGPGEDIHATAPWHTPGGAALQVPLAEVADVRIVEGPSMIPSENGRLRNYVTMTVSGDRDLVGFVEEAQRVVAEKVALPPGVHIEWAGEFEHQVRAARTLRLILPAVILLIFVILYLTYKDLADAGLMLLAVPEALAGGVFFQFLFPKLLHGWSAPPVDFTVAVWVGYIAAFGMATETGIIMLVYLREAIAKRGGLENIKSLEELRQAVIEGAVHRLRPKLLTEGVAIVALAPMLFAGGVGSEVLSAMALPVLGGLLIADEVVDIFLPVRFYWVRRARWLKLHQKHGQTAAGGAEARAVAVSHDSAAVLAEVRR